MQFSSYIYQYNRITGKKCLKRLLEKSFTTIPNSEKAKTKLDEVGEDLAHLRLEISKMRSHSLSEQLCQYSTGEGRRIFLCVKREFPLQLVSIAS